MADYLGIPGAVPATDSNNAFGIPGAVFAGTDPTAGIPGAIPAPKSDAERGFFAKMSESVSRGQERTMADVAVFKGLIGEGDLDTALKAQHDLRLYNRLDPIDGNLIADMAYGAAGITGRWYEFAKKGGKFAAVGALLGGVASVAFPTVGEEPAVVATGAKAGAWLGAKTGYGVGQTSYIYAASVGSMYGDMIERGTSPAVARQMAVWAGIPYTLIETMQIKGVTPSIAKGAQEVVQEATKKFIPTMIKKYGKTLAKEIAEEDAQEFVQIIAEDLGDFFEGKDVTIDKDYITARATRLLSVAKESAKSFALLPIPGAAIETAVQLEGAKMAAEQAEMENAKEEDSKSAELDLTTVDSPQTKLFLALQRDAETYATQENIRRVERAERFEKYEEIASNYGPREWFYKAQAALKGKYTELGVTPLENIIPIETFDMLSNELYRTDKLTRINAGNLSKALHKRFTEGKILRPHEIEWVRTMWGDTLANAFESETERITEVEPGFTDYIQIPKQLMASGDISRSFRQNISTIGQFSLFARSMVRDWSLFMKDEATAKRIQNEKIATVSGQKAIENGLRINEVGGGFKRGAERFAAKGIKWLDKVPLMKRSEVAYTYGGNIYRLELYNHFHDWMVNKNIASDKNLKDLAHVVNILTGEGDPKTFKQFAPFLNAVFFSPRLLEARFRSIVDIVNPFSDLGFTARKILATEMAKFAGINAAMLTAISSVPGVDVEYDPRSSNFGKVRIGDTRFDIGGGYLPLIRLIVQLGTGERKTQAGRIVDAETFELVTNFLKYKLGPAPALALDALTGTNFMGEPFDLSASNVAERFYQMVTPLWIQDVADAAYYQGWGTAMAAAPLAFHGVGVQSYKSSPGTSVAQFKNKVALDVTQKKWDDLSSDAQTLLKHAYPEIEIQERKADYEQRSAFGIEKIIDEQRKAGDRIEKKLAPRVRLELERLEMKVPGISRTIASDWRLNDNRYKDYENRVTNYFNQVLTKLVKSPVWKSTPDPVKQTVIKQVFKDLKEAARQQIITEANHQDIQSIYKIAERLRRQ